MMDKLAMEMLASMGFVLANMSLSSFHMRIKLHEARVILRKRISLWDAS